MIIGLGAGFLFIGLVTLLASIRFIRPGAGQRCRKCDYDLSGMTIDTRRCPECGKSLGPRDVIQTTGADSMKQARPVFRVLGSVATLVGVILLLVALEGSPRRLPWTPTWYLLQFDLPAAVPQQDSAVMQELLDRMNAGELAPEDHRAAAITIIEGSSGNTPQAFITGMGSYGNEILYPLIKSGQLTSTDLARSHWIAGRLLITPETAVEAGGYRWGMQLQSSYVFATPATPTMPRHDVHIKEVLLDGTLTDQPPFTLTSERGLYSRNAIGHYGQWGNDPVENPAEPGQRELVVRGEFAWSDHDGTSWQAGARQPFEVSALLPVRDETAPSPVFTTQPAMIEELRGELEANSHLAPDGVLTLGISKPVSASLLHEAKITLGLDLVPLFTFSRMLASRFSDPSLLHARDEERGVVVFEIQRLRVPASQRDRIPEVGSTVTIQLTPGFDLQKWYGMGGDEDNFFLAAPLEIEVQVKSSS
ncbi:MAG: hypothetical protein MK085_05785 [Phycisphaerales bacterium]|nr:hypothetical protein [Phycisphaerales bacterium]